MAVEHWGSGRNLNPMQFGSQGTHDLVHQANHHAMNKLHKYAADPYFYHKDTKLPSEEVKSAHMEAAAHHYRAERDSKKKSPTVVREKTTQPKRKLYG